MPLPAPLPLPPFFDPANAARFDHRPDAQALFAFAQGWKRAHALQPASSAAANVHLLLIDVQKDLCFPEGSLYVGGRSGRGAIDDTRRIAEFIHRHLGALTNITATFDTHFAYQIFFPSFWIDAHGAPLPPHREITVAQLDAGLVRPDPAMAKWLCNGDYRWLVAQVRHYCAELERAGQYKLYLWPPHCLLGSDGHTLAGLIQEARLFHSYTRSAQSWGETKGGHPLTENYSVMRPEVLTRHDGLPLAERNTAFLKTLLAADAILVAGQAASHCVKSSVEDILAEIRAHDPRLAKKVYLLTDCMSAVAVPDGRGGFLADFTPQAETALQRFADAGMNLVKSSEPLESWPGLRV